MSSQPSRFARHRHWHLLLSPLSISLFGYSIIMFIVALGDAVMAYSAPVYIESFVGSPFYMGLLLASSSVVGFIADVVIGKIFGNKNYYFFLFWTIIIGLSFPLSLLTLPPLIPLFLLAMSSWGIYFELMEFSSFHFVSEVERRLDNAKSWGTIYSFKSCAYLVGPLIASFLIASDTKFPFLAATLFFLFSLLASLFFHLTLGRKVHPHLPPPPPKRTILDEFIIWRLLFRHVWPVWLLTLTAIMVDATFWSVGTLLSEELKSSHPFGGWLITAYMAPNLLAIILVQRAARWGKRHIAFLTGIISGLFLFVAGFTTSTPLLLLFVFISSFFSGIAVPEILAASEDYITRLRGLGNDMIALERTASSLAYIIGPILAGAFAGVVGNQRTLSLVGLVSTTLAVAILIATPRKILLPQKALSQLEEKLKLVK